MIFVVLYIKWFNYNAQKKKLVYRMENKYFGQKILKRERDTHWCPSLF